MATYVNTKFEHLIQNGLQKFGSYFGYFDETLLQLFIIGVITHALLYILNRYEQLDQVRKQTVSRKRERFITLRIAGKQSRNIMIVCVSFSWFLINEVIAFTAKKLIYSSNNKNKSKISNLIRFRLIKKLHQLRFYLYRINCAIAIDE